MSAIKKLIISLIVMIGILAVALISVYIVARVNLGVDLFRTVGQLKTLSQPVNEQESFPAAYRSEDLADLKSQTDSQLGDVVLYEEGKGYEGYTVDFTALALSGATAKPVFLSERQAGALAEIVFHQQTGGELTIADKEISLCVLHITFTEIDVETGNADLNAEIGTTAANALIGTEQNPGFVYALKATGGSGSFAFVLFENEGKQINALVF